MSRSVRRCVLALIATLVAAAPAAAQARGDGAIRTAPPPSLGWTVGGVYESAPARIHSGPVALADSTQRAVQRRVLREGATVLGTAGAFFAGTVVGIGLVALVDRPIEYEVLTPPYLRIGALAGGAAGGWIAHAISGPDDPLWRTIAGSVGGALLTYAVLEATHSRDDLGDRTLLLVPVVSVTTAVVLAHSR